MSMGWIRKKCEVAYRFIEPRSAECVTCSA
jgi:hypothetical protein